MLTTFVGASNRPETMKFLRVLQWLEKTYFTDKDLKSKFNESQLVATLSPFDHELKMSVVCEAFASMSDSDGEFNDSVSTIQSNIGALELVAFKDFQEFFIILFSYLTLLSLVDLLKYYIWKSSSTCRR